MLKIDVETQGLIAAIERFGGPVMQRHCLEAAHVTATRVQAEAHARVARRSGRTARGILINVARQGTGYVVVATNPDQPGLPGWLEFGTQHMTKRPFFFTAAALESGAHERRMRQAIADAAEEVGLGG